MINILQLHSSSGLYGAESVIFNLSKALVSRGYNPTICSIEADKNQLSSFAKVAISEFDFNVDILLTKSKLSPIAIVKLLKLIRQRKIKLIHSHYSKATILAFFAAKLCNIPLIETNHLFPPMPLNNIKLQKYSRIGAFFLRYIDHTIAVSKKIKYSLHEYGVPLKKISVIENGIDIIPCQQARGFRQEVRDSFGLKKSDIVFGSVGRLTVQKGFEYLFQITKQITSKYNNVHFYLAGDGPLREKFDQFICSNNLDNRVKLIGFRKDILKIMSAFDIFVMPSIDEGLPIAMLEAMAIGIPIIVTAVGEIPAVISNYENGILVPPKDSNLLMENMINLIENRQLCNKLSKNALKTVKSFYSNQAMCHKYHHIYQDAITLKKYGSRSVK